MHYTYSAASPKGQDFRTGSCTAIVVPPIQYPSGYAVSVHGARVTSRSDAGVLTLAQSGRPHSIVTVAITPTPGGHTSLPQGSSIATCR
jgi:endoglycosylceramidase